MSTFYWSNYVTIHPCLYTSFPLSRSRLRSRSLCLFFSPSIYLSICLSAFLLLPLFSLSFYLSIYLSIFLSIYYLSIYPSLYIFSCLCKYIFRSFVAASVRVCSGLVLETYGSWWHCRPPDAFLRLHFAGLERVSTTGLRGDVYILMCMKGSIKTLGCLCTLPMQVCIGRVQRQPQPKHIWSRVCSNRASVMLKAYHKALLLHALSVSASLSLVSFPLHIQFLQRGLTDLKNITRAVI